MTIRHLIMIITVRSAGWLALEGRDGDMIISSLDVVWLLSSVGSTRSTMAS